LVWGQAFLIAAANVSKSLRGVNEGTAARRQELREELDTSDESPVRDRAIRNHFEHFDERIEGAAPSRIFIDSTVMPREAISVQIAQATEQSQLRNYDPLSHTLTFWEDEIRVGEVVSELVRIGMATGYYQPSSFVD
jgi:hypothetical protein